MFFEELKEKASTLPQLPGVYIMRNKNGAVIYVGKAKKLKNRVSQYFQDTASHSPKTKLMVSKIDHFDVIVAASEFEALVLECSLIKQYLPKYNILLKDDKGYPYLRVNMNDAYPTITMVSRIADDGAEYFGPFGSRGITNSVLDAIRLILRLPNCNKRFPQDIGKGRACLNYHMNQCDGWCQKSRQMEYRATVEQARQLLLGNYKQVSDEIRTQMHNAAECLNFELAASLRDRLNAVKALGQKQLLIAGSFADMDVVGFAQTESKACFTVFHFAGGNLLDKDYELLTAVEDPKTAVSSLLKQYYLSRGFAPRIIMLPFEMEDALLFEQLLEQKYGNKTKIKVPKRGDIVKLVELAIKNAEEEALRITTREERSLGTLKQLSKMLGINVISRIEAFDISNISGTDIVGSMVVFQDGRPRKSDYKRFKIAQLENQDDYASMYQIVKRRFAHYNDGDVGFDILPDLLLIDGGTTHAKTAVMALSEVSLQLPVYGMVKDNRHRTRALVTPNGQEIAIDGQQAVYALIGNIQEETHRFAITYHRQLRSKRLKYSELDSIPGIGPKRKELLLKTFKSIASIKQADLQELMRILPSDVASKVYHYFRKQEEM